MTEEQPFESRLDRRTDVILIHLYGELNSAAAEAFNMAYAEALQEHPSMIAMDFANVSYINSSGIAMIIRLITGARRAGYRLAAYGLTKHFAELFNITRISEYMVIYESEESLFIEINSDR